MDPIYRDKPQAFTWPGRARRSIIISVAIASIIAVTGCDDSLAPVAGNVTGDATGLGGSFKFVPGTLENRGIRSDGTGGACLLVAMRDVPGYGNGLCNSADIACGQKRSTLQLQSDW